MIFITGASGFVGRAIGFILDSEGIPHKLIKRSQLYNNLSDFLKLNKCDTLIHCAWFMDYENPINRDENKRLNNEVLDAIINVNKMIFISSINVLNLNDVYSQDKRNWEVVFSNQLKKLDKKMSTIYLPHLIAPEVGINNNSVIYTFYKHWKFGIPLNVYNDMDICYTDLISFKEILLQSIESNEFTRLSPRNKIASVACIKAKFLSKKLSCPIIDQLKCSKIIDVKTITQEK